MGPWKILTGSRTDKTSREVLESLRAYLKGQWGKNYFFTLFFDIFPMNCDVIDDSANGGDSTGLEHKILSGRGRSRTQKKQQQKWPEIEIFFKWTPFCQKKNLNIFFKVHTSMVTILRRLHLVSSKLLQENQRNPACQHHTFCLDPPLWRPRTFWTANISKKILLTFVTQ